MQVQTENRIPKKVIVHCCGGAGINIVDKNIEYLLKRDSAEKAALVFNAIDTSDANFPKALRLKEHASFYRIDKDTLDGSGGIRGRAAVSIASKKGVPTYIEENGYIEPKRGELHVIISSASGASGNVIATTLLKRLLDKDIPVLIILVGDDTSAKNCENTKKVLLTINNNAAVSSKALTISYFLNNQIDDEVKSYKASQSKVDANIGIFLDILRTFNGSLRDLDFADLSNVINPNLNDYGLNKGIYMLSFYIGELDPAQFKSGIPVMSRSVLVDPDAYVPLSLLDSKVGFADEALKENTVEHYGLFNLHLVLSVCDLQSEVNYLNNKENDIKEVLGKIKGSSFGVDATEDILVL